MSSVDESLLSMEKLDRTSPELWPEQIPGMLDFAPFSSLAANGAKDAWTADFTSEDMTLLNQFSNLSMPALISEVKRLHDLAYQLGLEEAKEMTRGKYLNILSKRRR
ncbi:Protein lin-52-like protein [Frankliniella fusca]|uniref:Protein lin-52-like protein n=1 Tax=Frankliniella fusca TaxID=407009 RepID=A0AAE1H1A8_9NEOP|nr:Protein lin-52-like protein [Frankliniella fusca]